MTEPIRMHDIVALLEEVPAEHFATREPLLLIRGEIGTVVMDFKEPVYEVEFADKDGRTYAMVTLRPDQILVLRERELSAAA